MHPVDINKVSIIQYWLWLMLMAGFAFSCHDENTAVNDQPLVQIAVSTTKLAFGHVQEGRSIDQTLEITNTFSFGKTLSGTMRISGEGFSIIRGGEPFNLAPGESRTVVVRFLPARVTTYTGSLTIIHNGVNVLSPIIVELIGRNVITNSVRLTVSSTTVDFGVVNLGQSSTKSLTITNIASGNQTISGTITVYGSAFSATSGAGSFVLNAGLSLSVNLKFIPLTEATYSGSISISSDNLSSPISVALTGRGTSALLADIIVTPASIKFGTVSVDSSPSKEVIVVNSQQSTSTLSGRVDLSPGSSGFSLSNGFGSFSLAPGQSRSVIVVFSAAQAGSYTGNVQISHDGKNKSNPIVVPLEGNKTTSILMTVNPPYLDYGTVSVGQYSTQQVSIENSLSSTGLLTGTATVNGVGFSISNGGSNYSLAPGESKVLTIRFFPLDNTSYSGSLAITNSSTSSANPFTVPLAGNGEWQISILVSTAIMDFGSVTIGQSVDQSLTFTNSPDSKEVLSGVVSFGTGSGGFSFVTGNGTYSLQPGQTKTITVRFTPDEVGEHGGEIQIWHNAQNTYDPYSVRTRGYGTLR